MRENDFDEFGVLLDDLAAFYPTAKTPTAGFKAMYFRALSHLDVDAVRVALSAHLRDPQRGRFMPLPADVAAQVVGILANDTRPGCEEAWATAMRGDDELETVVWTAETSQAFAVASPILNAGDEVGARMAFREAYNRLVEEARRGRAPVAWSVSEGLDPQRRAGAIAAAVARGLVGEGQYPSLPAPRAAVALLDGPLDTMPEKVRLNLLGIRAWLTRPKDVASAEAPRPHKPITLTEEQRRDAARRIRARATTTETVAKQSTGA
jgi:hypothetical protein